MNASGFWRIGAAVLALALVSGCGGGGVASTPQPASPAPTPTPSPAPTPTPTPNPTFQTSEYNRSDGPGFHKAIPAWQSGATGQGVTIGIIDSGIDVSSPEFAGRISSASGDVAGTRGLANPDSDHGTNVAMVAAAARDNTGIMGIAWSATIAMFRADTQGTCANTDGCTFNDNAIASGIDRAVGAGARVINVSLGGSAPNAVLRAAIQRASAAGAVIVVSAGNDGDSVDPAINPNNPDLFASGLRAAGSGNVIIAGSVNDQGVFSAFSNRAGTEQDWFLSALGEKVCCVYDNGVLKVTTDANGQRIQYVFSGTSFSAPQIAGAAALLRQAFPNLTAAQVVDILLRSARDGGLAGTDGIYGRGILDIANAFSAQGVTAMANSAEPIALGDSSVATSPAMGDAGASSQVAAVVLDGYGRAYEMNLAGTLRAAQLTPRLGNALAARPQTVNLAAGRLALAFAVDPAGRTRAGAWTGQLRLSADDAEAARVLSARMVAALAPDLRIAVAYRQSADGLTASLQGRSQPAFLIAGSPFADYGVVSDGGTAVAVRRSFGPLGLTVDAGRDTVLTAAPMALADGSIERRRAAGVSRFGLSIDRRFGPLESAFGASWLREDRTVLGAWLHDSLGSKGADSLFLDAAGAWSPAADWKLGAAVRRGYTSARVAGTVAAGSRLTSTGWAVDISRSALFQSDDSLAFRLAQPLRVDSGGLTLSLPVAYSYQTLSATMGNRRLNLSPSGRERIAELAWRGTLWEGAMIASAYYRTDPGHRASLRDDQGLALSWSRAF